MISIILTTFNEPQTLSRAIKSILEQKIDQDYEILVIGPDKQTAQVVNKFLLKYPQIKYLKDQGKGKPAALNLGFQRARGEIYVCTDGDVYIGKNSLKALLRPFQDDKVGAVTGQPISLNPKNNLFGYWAYFLTQAAHQWRLKGNNFPCSGYLYAFRPLINKIPANVLAEDGIITEMIRQKGGQIKYAPQAQVYVKYPDNFKDWLKQKVRSTGGYKQKQSRGERNFKQELKSGLKLFFTLPQNLKEYFWTILLYLARIYLWLKIFWEIKIKNKSLANIWQRVESTK